MHGDADGVLSTEVTGMHSHFYSLITKGRGGLQSADEVVAESVDKV